jgi:hypothetical protein
MARDLYRVIVALGLLHREAVGNDHESWHVDVIDAGLALQSDGIGRLDA